MTEAGDKLLAGVREAVAVARGEVLAARIYHQGHAYVPEQQWQPIETAPKDGRSILVWGLPSDIDGLRFTRPGIHTAYWDSIDGTFCLSGATWAGPFIAPTHWQPLPPPPLT